MVQIPVRAYERPGVPVFKVHHGHLWAVLVGFMVGVILTLCFILVADYMRLSTVERSIYGMKRTCGKSYKVIDGALEIACNEMIKDINKHGFRVFNSGGVFWVD